MKLKPLLAAAIVLTATPAFAAPQWVETACWRYANRILPAPTPREREACLPIASPTGRLEPRRPRAKEITTATDIDWQSPWSLILARHRAMSRQADGIPRGARTSG